MKLSLSFHPGKCRLVHIESICSGQIKFGSNDLVCFHKIENNAENDVNADCQQSLYIYNAIIKALKTLLWHLSREPMKEISSLKIIIKEKKKKNSNV